MLVIEITLEVYEKCTKSGRGVGAVWGPLSSKNPQKQPKNGGFGAKVCLKKVQYDDVHICSAN